MSSQAAAVDAFSSGRSRRWGAIGGVGVLSAALLASGALAYAFQVLCARALGPDAFGQIAVLWAALFLATVVLFRPIEQTLSRGLANRIARDEEVRSVVRSVAGLVGGIALVLLAVFGLAWKLLTDHLFLGNDVLTLMLAIGIFTFGASYTVRGAFGGIRWFRGYGLVLVTDAVARLLIATPLLIVASVDLAAAALACGAVVGTLVPVYLGRRVVVEALAEERRGADFKLGSALRFAAPATAIAAADQLLVNGAPILVMLEGGDGASRAAGLVFAATMLVRVPVYLFQGFAASLLPNLTRMQATSAGLSELRLAVVRTIGLLLAIGVVSAALGAAVGPAAMQLLFGSDFEAARLHLGLLGIGVGFYLGSATISQALLALDCGTRAAVAWMVSAGVFVALFAGLSGSDLGRISAAFAAATLTCLVGLAVVLVRRLGR